MRFKTLSSLNIRHKTQLILIMIMATISFVVAGFTIYILYEVSFEEQRQRLVEIAGSQARLIEAVARFDSRYSADYPEGSAAATVSQIRDAHSDLNYFSSTGEFTLARREGNQIVFLLGHRHHDFERPVPVSFVVVRRDLPNIRPQTRGFRRIL